MLEKIVDKLIGCFRKSKLKREIVVNVERLETRVAILENGRLEEYMVEHPEDERLVGCIFKGRVENLEDELQAAFVNIGLKKNAFLHYWDMSPDADALMEDDEEEENGKNGGKNGKNGKNGRHRPPRLTNEEIHNRYPPGSEIIVQVTKGPISTKGPRVTTNLSIAGRYLVMMPNETARNVSRKIEKDERTRLKKILDRLPVPEGVGLIVRTAAAGTSAKAFVRDLQNLLESWKELDAKRRMLRTPCCIYQEPGLVERVVRDWLTEDVDAVMIDDKAAYEELCGITRNISRRARGKMRLYEGAQNVFDRYGVDRQLEDAFQRKVPLKSGGYLVIDETEALIAVDVNTGHHKNKNGDETADGKKLSGRNRQEESILQVNLEAVEEVARQLRLRNIGGLVVLDLIDMKSRKHQNQVYKALKAALKRDRARTNVLQISELGLLEMSRQRQEESILSMLSSTCPCCDGHGVIKSPLAVSIEIQRTLTTLLKEVEAGTRAPFEPITELSPTVLNRLKTEDAKILGELQTRFHTKLRFRTAPHHHPEYYAVLDAETGNVVYSSDKRSKGRGAGEFPVRTPQP